MHVIQDEISLGRGEILKDSRVSLESDSGMEGEFFVKGQGVRGPSDMAQPGEEWLQMSSFQLACDAPFSCSMESKKGSNNEVLRGCSGISNGTRLGLQFCAPLPVSNPG